MTRVAPYLVMMLACALLAAFAAGGASAEDAKMRLLSPAFGDHETIPDRYTCEGADISPPLAWGGVPAEAKSLALAVTDPDAPDPRAPRMIWVHWVAHNIPASAEDLPEGASGKVMPPGAVEGVNSWKRTGYGGPCPPIGAHRYIFTLYALDATLPPAPMTKDQLKAAMNGHVLDKAELIGMYEKQH